MSGLAPSDHFKRNYENYYEAGDSEWRWLGALDKAANIVSLCSSYPHESALEIGAGEGSILKRLSELEFCRELYALEISPTGVETINNKAIPRLVECVLFDGHKIPYEDDRFHLSLLSHVIEHAEYPRRLLYEAARVSKYVFVEVPLEDNARLSTDLVMDSVGHINFYSQKTFRRLIQSCGLQILRHEVTNPSKRVYTYKNGKKGLLKYLLKEGTLRVFPRIAGRLFTYHSALVCRRK